MRCVPLNLDDPDGHYACASQGDAICPGETQAGMQAQYKRAAAYDREQALEQAQEEQQQQAQQRKQFQQTASRVCGAAQLGDCTSSSQVVETLGAQYGDYLACLKNNAKGSSAQIAAACYGQGDDDPFYLIHQYLTHGGSSAALAGSVTLGAKLCKATDCGFHFKDLLGLVPLAAGAIATDGEADGALVDAEDALGIGDATAAGLEATANTSADDYLADAAESCLNSFTGATPVTMADGKEEPISAVKVGDKVLATDPQTRKTESRPVVALIRHSGQHTMVDLTFSDGSTITATNHHLFWDATRDTFTDAIDLRAGDKVLSDSGHDLTVTATRSYNENLTAYNLEISGIHTYYAGTTPVLVHNSCDALSQLGELPDRNGYTRAGRAFQKHFFRPGGSSFSPPTAAGFAGGTQAPGVLNALGQDTLDDLLTDPRTAIQTYGSTADYRLPWGGARFVNGSFSGFLSP